MLIQKKPQGFVNWPKSEEVARSLQNTTSSFLCVSLNAVTNIMTNKDWGGVPIPPSIISKGQHQQCPMMTSKNGMVYQYHQASSTLH